VSTIHLVSKHPHIIFELLLLLSYVYSYPRQTTENETDKTAEKTE